MATKKSNSNPIDLFFPEMQLAKGSPRFQIIVAHGVVELLVNTLVELCCKNGRQIIDDARLYPHSTKVLILHERGVISDSQFKMLDGFRKLRNKAAHGTFVLTQEMLIPYEDILVKNNLQKFYSVEKFYEICIIVVGSFWNSHITYFRPFFEPELQAELERQALIHNSLNKS